MQETQALLSLDWSIVVLGIVAILSLSVLLMTKVDYLKDKFGIKTKWDLEHELLLKTTQELHDLQKSREQDIKDFKTCDKNIHDELKVFAVDLHSALSDLKSQVEKYEEVHAKDVQLNTDGHKELANSIHQLLKSSEEHDKQIGAVCDGVMELLGDKIDTSFSRYVSMGGIPENEVDEFDGAFIAYSGLHGNGKRKEKYRYVKGHLPIIPDKTLPSGGEQ